MKERVFIDIFHENEYYLSGLQFWLKEYFSLSNYKAVVNSPLSDEEKDFRIIISSSSMNRALTVPRGGRYREVMANVFVSLGGTPVHQKQTGCGWLYVGALPYNGNDTELENVLKKALSYDRHNLEKKTCPGCAEALFSPRERSVIAYLKKGISQSQTAERMNISVKTVHSHKRSVMKKMGLNRNYDFIMWLIQ